MNLRLGRHVGLASAAVGRDSAAAGLRRRRAAGAQTAECATRLAAGQGGAENLRQRRDAAESTMRSAGAGEEGADGGAEGEPFGVALEAAPEVAAFGGLEGGVAFAGESGGAGLLVLEIGLGGGEL